VTSLRDDADKDALLSVLNERSGHFRHELAQNSTLRTTPKLNFIFDSSIEYGSRLSALIDSVQVKSDSEPE
jgi:ribosome-binding factor A